MSMMPILIVASVLGVKWGWQPVSGGGIEYIIRVEPHAVEALRAGRDIFSDLPPQIQRVRSYRITVSNDPVPHEGEMPPANATEANATESAPSDAASTTAPSLRPPPSGTATAARQPVDDDATPPPPAAAAVIPETPAGEQPPPTFQPPATPAEASAPPAAGTEEPGRSRRGWPERREGATSAAPNFAPPPGSNSGFSNANSPQMAPATTAAPAGTTSGPNLQPPTSNWPNRPSYDQTNSAPPAYASPSNAQPAGFGPTSPSDQPVAKNEWYNPPTAGQSPPPAQDPRYGSQANGIMQNRNGQAQYGNGQSQYGNGQTQYTERDLFGRPTNGTQQYYNNAQPFSTPAKHANETLAQNFAAAEDRAVAEVESKPWVLVVTLLVLFASVGLNVYLGMISWDLYERYRTTIDQLKTATEARVA